ncbi:MAG: hypothetical protein IJV67_08520 [Clostridia bacterium]|nr:hypothetical protein [Clostridia bacterium]MBQ9710182.1 hypothetical protein [Clostridia bacterium]MBQ9710649.1 hypothetical protein [Clostridia bacterium]
MSSFDTARENWELEQMKKAEETERAAANGNPKAMEELARSIWRVQYNCDEKVIELLTAASDAGNDRASWLLADLYAGLDEEKYHDKIEFYCRRALKKGRRYSDLDPDDFLCHCIFEWIEKHHPEGLRWKKSKIAVLFLNIFRFGKRKKYNMEDDD